MPGCDGSAQAFVEAIDAAGVVEQRSPVRQIVVGAAVRVGDDDSWIEAQPPRTPGLSISFELDYGAQPAIGRQTYRARRHARFVPPRTGGLPHVHSARGGPGHAGPGHRPARHDAATC